jgi:hypothetical protein
MRKIAPLCASLAAAFVLAMPVMPARATNQISFISGSGSDANNNSCNSQATPCQSLSQALANTIDKGTVICVGGGVTDNSAIFNGTTITQSVTIDCGAARLFSLGLLGINGAGIVVRLRNLSFDGSGRQPSSAISVGSVAELHIENCTIHNISGNPGVGILFTPSGSLPSRLVVADSVITGSNGQNIFSSGILVQPTGSGLTQVVIERTRIEQGVIGIVADASNSSGQVQVEVKDSLIANNNIGAVASSGSSGLAVVSLTDSHSVSNGTGVLATGQQSVVILDRTTIQASTFQAVTASNGGAVFSYGNNPINNNAQIGTVPRVIGQH